MVSICNAIFLGGILSEGTDSKIKLKLFWSRFYTNMFHFFLQRSRNHFTIIELSKAKLKVNFEQVSQKRGLIIV